MQGLLRSSAPCSHGRHEKPQRLDAGVFRQNMNWSGNDAFIAANAPRACELVHTPCCLLARPDQCGTGYRASGLNLHTPRARIPHFTEAHLKPFIFIAAIALLATAPARSQPLVDPNKVAPEYREAAEKRRAEQLRQRECAMKADLEKVLPRDRTAFLNHCLDMMAAKQ